MFKLRKCFNRYFIEIYKTLKLIYDHFLNKYFSKKSALKMLIIAVLMIFDLIKTNDLI